MASLIFLLKMMIMKKYDDYYDGNFEDDVISLVFAHLAVTLLVIMERDGAANCGCAWRCHLWRGGTMTSLILPLQ